MNINDVIGLYDSNIPIREISRRLKLDRSIIRKILLKSGIKIRDSRSSLISMGYIKEKNKFVLQEQERAYLFGLVMGDLTPVKRSNYTLKLITHTTHKKFIDLLQKSFEIYGHTSSVINKRNEFRFSAYLDLESFSFLLETRKDNIPEWIFYKDNFLYFLAGFIDSDGSIILRKSGKYFQYVIRFFSQNLNLLLKIKDKLENLGYRLSIHKSHSKGTISYYKGIKFIYNKDYYTLEIYRKEETLDLLSKIPIRHQEKIAKREFIFSVESQKFIYWKSVEEKTKELKSLIKQSVIQRIY